MLILFCLNVRTFSMKDSIHFCTMSRTEFGLQFSVESLKQVYVKYINSRIRFTLPQIRGNGELDFCWLQQRASFILQQSILYLQTLPKVHQTDSGTSVQELNSRFL